VPELPEVETTRRGIAPHLEGRRILRLEVRERRLRWPVAPGLEARVAGARVAAVRRRAKYLLIDTDRGTGLLHLGMSGSLRVVPAALPPGRHDHLDLLLDSGRAVRFNDPRRFGSLHWLEDDPAAHPLLAGLGPEPLAAGFDGAWLYRASRGLRVAAKPFVMNARVVVGVGNIYASEALFRAGIHPRRPAGRVGPARMEALAAAIRQVLAAAIEAGGTTLRDFTDSEGRPGYFRQHLTVYGRAGEPCPGCGAPIRQEVIGQRASYFCPACQR
jgi:formamidopyrimidine-DNA glycosylase